MAKKLTPLSSKYAQRRNRLWLTAGLFGIVVTGLVGAVVASKMNFDLRNEAAGKNKANAKLKNEVCDLEIKSDFDSMTALKRDWVGYDINGGTTSNVSVVEDELKLDTTLAGDKAAFVGVRSNRGASTKFTASIKLSELTATKGSGATGAAGTLRFGLVTELSDAGLSGNFLEVEVLADSQKMARVMTMDDDKVTNGSQQVELPPVTSEEDIILVLSREGDTLSANFKSKGKTEPVALGTVKALPGSGSYDILLTANPKHQLVTKVDRFASNVCHYTCKGASDSSGKLTSTLESKWYQTTTGNSTVTSDGDHVILTASADGNAGDYRATLTNRQIFRGPFDSQIRVDLEKSDIKKNSGVHLQFANLNGTRKAMIWVEQGQDGKFYISGAMFDGEKFVNPGKVEQIGKEANPVLSIQRWDRDVRLRYKKNGQGEWKTLHTFKDFYGGVGQMSVFMNTTPNELATAKAAVRNFQLNCTTPIFPPTPAPATGGGTAPVDPGTSVDPGSEGGDTSGGGTSGSGTGSGGATQLTEQQKQELRAQLNQQKVDAEAEKNSKMALAETRKQASKVVAGIAYQKEKEVAEQNYLRDYNNAPTSAKQAIQNNYTATKARIEADYAAKNLSIDEVYKYEVLEIQANFQEKIQLIDRELAKLN